MHGFGTGDVRIILWVMVLWVHLYMVILLFG